MNDGGRRGGDVYGEKVKEKRKGAERQRRWKGGEGNRERGEGEEEGGGALNGSMR